MAIEHGLLRETHTEQDNDLDWRQPTTIRRYGTTVQEMLALNIHFMLHISLLDALNYYTSTSLNMRLWYRLQ